MLEVFTALAVVPKHVLYPACKRRNKCTTCLETGGQTFLEKIQCDVFRAHIWRIPTEKGDAKFRLRIKYMLDLSALHLPANYQISYMRHLSLRAVFSKLSKLRLVLDPSCSLSQNLLRVPNLEQKISSVMRKSRARPFYV